MNIKLVATVPQMDQKSIEIFHCSEGGEEWFTLTQHGAVPEAGLTTEVRVSLAGITGLIGELQRLKNFYGSPLLESPSYSTGQRRW